MREESSLEREVMPSRCPLEGAELLTANAEGACGCPSCRGVWLPGPLVSDCVGADVTTALRGRVGEATQLTCPDDSLPLNKIRFHGITLDLCISCCGVWFDRNDLDMMHQHRNALGIGSEGGVPVYAKRGDSEGTWADSLIHFILFAARG